MRRLGNVTKSQEVFERHPHIRRVSESVAGQRHGPLVAKALAVDVQMRYADLLVIRIPMRRTTEIESDEHYDLTCPVLHFDLEEVDATTAQIKQELLAFVHGLKRKRQRLSAHRKIGAIRVGTVFFHSD